MGKCVKQFQKLVIDPEFPNKHDLTEAEWKTIVQKFEDYKIGKQRRLARR